MKNRIIFLPHAFMLAGVLTGATITACGPSSPPPPESPPNPTARDGIGTPIGDACEHLRAQEIGCPEGKPTKKGLTCYEHLSNLSKLTEIPIVCVTAAKTRDDVRACGSANTTRFRCIE